MNKVKMALAGLCMLSMFGLLLLPHGAAAQGSGRTGNVTSSALAQAATPTPDAMMAEATNTPEAAMMAEGTPTPDAMMAEGTATPDAMMAEGTATPEAMMAEATNTPEAAMMQHPGDNMTSGTLPATGSSDYSGLLWLGAGAIVLLAGGLGLRRTLASKK